MSKGLLILPIGGGGVQPSGTLEIRSEGTFDVTDYAEVDVDIFDDTTTKTIDENGTYNASDDEVLGYSQVTVNVEPDLGVLNVTPSTQAQVIIPSNIDGWDEVNVAAVSSNIDPDIQPANIRKNVNILGVTGTMEEGITPEGTLNIVNNGTYDITNYANVTVQVASGNFNELCFTAEEANCTVGMTHLGTNQTTTKPLMYYSTDNRQTWTSWDGSNITLANVGDKMYVYGDNLDGFNYSSNDRSNFVTSGRVSASGNVMSLITRYGDREYIPNNLCFYYLFSGTTITTAPELPATTLTNQCYQSMFSNCTNLTTPPSVLPATTLANNCYYSMFYGCTSLTTAPALPATTLADNCYNAMFKGCTSLTTAPSVLPSTILAGNCYQEMFQNCTSLTTAPELPATALPQYCYNRMFSGCTSLTTAPALPATTLGTSCYNQMFNGCTQLNKITIYADSWNTGWTSNWVNNVSGSGTFIKPNALQTGSGTGQIPLNSTNGIPTGWTVYEIPSVVSDDNEYITLGITSGYDIYYTTDGSTPTTSSTLYTAPIDATAIGDTFTLKIISSDGNGFVSPVVEYKYLNMFYIEALQNNTVLNLQNWSQQYSSSGQRVAYSTDKLTWASIPRNTTAYTLANAGDKVYFRRWQNNSDTWGYGNISGVTSGTIKTGGCLEYALYWDITGNRPAAAGCGNMFQNCTGLVDASDLVLVGTYYQSMFQGCTNLTAIPALPATTLVNNSYMDMFNGCTSLTTAPALPATTLETNCYRQMFYNCTSLTTAPTIAATIIPGGSCNGMFSGCTSLVNVPNLNATTIGNNGCSDMFKGCTALVVAPSLPATTLGESSYYSMFEGCTSLSVAPYELPALTLNYWCYKSMFKNCTSLTTAPVLKFTTWYSNSNGADLNDMFNGCTNLNFVDVSCTTWKSGQASNWLANVSNSGTFIKPSSLVIGTGSGQIPASSANGIPAGWTVEEGTTNPKLYVSGGPLFRFVITGDWPNDGVTRTVGDIEVYDGDDEYQQSDINITVRNGVIDYDDDDWNRSYGQRYIISNTNRQLVIETELEDSDWYTEFDQYYKNCDDWQSRGYSDYEDCMCNENQMNCPAEYLCFTAEQANSTVALSIPSGISVELYKSTDGTNFTSWDGSAITLANVGDKIYMYGNNLGFSPSLNVYCQFVMTGRIAASGDITTLLTPNGTLTIPSNMCFYGLFENCSSLTTAPELPATTLSDMCYSIMFSDCTNLTSAPELPATSLYVSSGGTLGTSCYQAMFQGCTSLTTAPDLPATTLSNRCYYDMFKGCTSLTTAPSALPATSLTPYCYVNMFQGCTSLVNAPSTLPATTLANECYNSMFDGCTSLTTAPEIKATTIDDLYQTQNMFNNCSSLNSIKVDALTMPPSNRYGDNWMNGVSATGTFTKPSGTTIVNGADGIPTGWTVVNV